MNFFVVPMNTPALLGRFHPNEQEYFCMKSKNFEWLADEFVLYCRSVQLRENHLQLLLENGILYKILLICTIFNVIIIRINLKMRDIT